MSTPRSIKRYFALAISAAMVWAMVLTPYTGDVKAQVVDHDYTATPSYTEVGSYVYLQATSLEPNRTYWLSYDHNREHVNGICPDETFTADADGRWTKLIGPFTPSDVGDWGANFSPDSYCGAGYIHTVSWQVSPVPYRVSVNNTVVGPTSGPSSFFISGAPPNSPIDWTTYKDGEIIEKERKYGEYTDANGQFTKSNDPNSPLAWEALSQSLGHLVGHADGNSWLVSPGVDGAGWMQYGPYTTQVPAGAHTAVWNLMIDNNTADNNVVAAIDVFDYTAQTQLAYGEITRQSFSAPNKYKAFRLTFDTDASQAGHAIECRVYWHGNSYMRELAVSVDPAWGHYGPGEYMKVAHVYDPIHYVAVQARATVAFKVLAQPKFNFNISPQLVPMNGYAQLQVTGAPPNKPINWTRYLNGQLWDEGQIGTTDANGNWSMNNGPWSNDAWKGMWTYQITIEGVSVTKQFGVGNLVNPTPPSTLAYSVTDVTFDPGSGKYYSDVQVHMAGSDPTEEPAVDVTTRAWFNDSQGAQPISAELGALTMFSGVITSGDICSQVPQVPPIDPDCLECATGLGEEYTFDYNLDYILILATAGIGYFICFDIGLAIPVLGIPIAVACILFTAMQTAAALHKADSNYKQKICTLPGTCSLNTQKNCSKVLNGLPVYKALCKGIVR